jgi:hypothetical protein
VSADGDSFFFVYGVLRPPPTGAPHTQREPKKKLKIKKTKKEKSKKKKKEKEKTKKT